MGRRSKDIQQSVPASQMSKKFSILVSSALYLMTLWFISTNSSVAGGTQRERDDRPMGLHSKIIQQNWFHGLVQKLSNNAWPQVDGQEIGEQFILFCAISVSWMKFRTAVVCIKAWDSIVFTTILSYGYELYLTGEILYVSVSSSLYFMNLGLFLTILGPV